MKLSVVSDNEVGRLRAENVALREALKNLMETFADVCVIGMDGHFHVSYSCDGRFGYYCRCGAHQALTDAKGLLNE